MVEWIEIDEDLQDIRSEVVSTLVVEWIEILAVSIEQSDREVSTLVVEWIEILVDSTWTAKTPSLHPRGGVD